MLRVLVAALAVFASLTVGSLAGSADRATCDDIAELAQSVMEGRQLGVSESSMRRAFRPGTVAENALARELVEGAYSVPVDMSDPVSQARSFAEGARRACRRQVAGG
jgi:hypothetical protein